MDHFGCCVWKKKTGGRKTEKFKDCIGACCINPNKRWWCLGTDQYWQKWESSLASGYPVAMTALLMAWLWGEKEESTNTLKFSPGASWRMGLLQAKKEETVFFTDKLWGETLGAYFRHVKSRVSKRRYHLDIWVWISEKIPRLEI